MGKGYNALAAFLIGRIIMIAVGFVAAVCLGIGSVVFFRQRDGRGG